ncbi:ankyrin repeat-containing domain protein [Aspergillus bertholletiae]|uniref:Ankyrin repeat-containing domain protein n=1 Tax=Aspergillus bertholletiae TaxID=1226010 RepID=A0A5N7B1F0_9EURO|nr:ankyrin repeat-containing domain protein [Aspergillus bertholletiae]
MSFRDEYTVGWICSIRKEYVAARCFLDEIFTKGCELPIDDNNDYTFGRLGSHLVVIAVLPNGVYGTCSAATVARDMLRSFQNIEIGLLVGIGGGAPSQSHDIRLGDVVVSTPCNNAGGVIQYDFGKRIQNKSFQDTGFVNMPPPHLLTAMNGLQAKYDGEGCRLEKSIANVLTTQKILQEEYQRPHPCTDKLYKSEFVRAQSDKVDSARPKCVLLIMKCLRRILPSLLSSLLRLGTDCDESVSNLVVRPPRTVTEGNPMIHYGLIASGNQLMKDALVRDRLAADKGVLCFEMEAAGVMNHFPCLVIRGICDYSDTHKNDQWQGYAAMVAAAYARDLLDHILPRQIRAGAERSREDEAIRKYFSGKDYSLQQKDYFDKWQKGTGEWLIKSKEFQNWMGQDSQTLFCPGIPGAGKTFVVSFVIDYLCQNYQRGLDMNVGIAYVYFEWKEPQISRHDLLLSLLSLLIRPSIPEAVRRFYKQHKKRATLPSSEDIMGMLISVIEGYKKTFIIVDALDECNGSVGSQSEVLATLFSLQDKTRANLFVTSRHIRTIETKFQQRGSIILEIHARDEDIRRYLDGHAAQLPNFVLENPEWEKKIKQAIIKAADGMFLLAYLHLRSLEPTVTVSEIKKILKMLPKVSDAYKQAYSRIKDRIRQQSTSRRELAARIISWIFRSRRPLRILELQHALAATENSSTIDLDSIPTIEVIVDVCAGLVTADQSRGIVRLVHYTAQEYIDRYWREWIPDADLNIVKTCMTYLSYDNFEKGPTTSVKEYWQRLNDSPFYEYVARYWGFHAKEVYLEAKQSISRFLRHGPALASAVQILLEENPIFGPLKNLEGIIGLHIAAYFGINQEVMDFLKDTPCTDTVDSAGRTAAHWAVMGEQVRTVEILLLKGFSVTATDIEMKSVLHYAASKGNGVMTRLLLSKGATTEIRDIDEQTPLLAAADKLGIAATKELLDAGAFVNAVNGMGQNALHLAVLAAKDQSAHLAELLLSRGIDASVCDIENMTPLHYAVATGNRQVADILLQAAVDINAGIERNLWTASMETGKRIYQKHEQAETAEKSITNVAGLTPLHFAACIGHCSMAEYLLSQGANPNLQSHDGDTPLHIALNRGVLDSAQRRLTNKDAWTDNTWQVELSTEYISDYEGEELHEIYEYIDAQRLKVLQTLLARSDIDVNVANTALDSPLHRIRYGDSGSEEVVQTLLTKGADAFTRNRKGQTALHLACHAGSSTNVCTFLDWGCSITNKDSEGLTALHHAVRQDNCDTVKVILNKDKEACRQLCIETDRQGRSLLHHHLKSSVCSLEIVTILLDHGVSVNNVDNNGDTPLSLYLGLKPSPRAAICLYLLQKGADTFWTNSKGENLAHLAMRSWKVDVEVLKVLLYHGVDLSAKDNSGKNILHHGAICGSASKDILDFIFEENLLNWNDRDEAGMTPFAYVLHESKKTQCPNTFASGRWKCTMENFCNLAEEKGVELEVEMQTQTCGC